MLNKSNKEPRNEDMYRAILELKDLEECHRFFNDLCTIMELQAMEQRYEVAKCLYEGKNYNDTLEATGASTATISRVNRSLKFGEDGYGTVFERLGYVKKEE